MPTSGVIEAFGHHGLRFVEGGEELITLLALVGALAGLSAGARGVVLLTRGLAHADDERSSLAVIRGIRGIAIAVGTGALAAGIVLGQTWLLASGLVFLLEELYETGVVILVLRRAARPSRPPTVATEA